MIYFYYFQKDKLVSKSRVCLHVFVSLGQWI